MLHPEWFNQPERVSVRFWEYSQETGRQRVPADKSNKSHWSPEYYFCALCRIPDATGCAGKRCTGRLFSGLVRSRIANERSVLSPCAI